MPLEITANGQGRLIIEPAWPIFSEDEYAAQAEDQDKRRDMLEELAERIEKFKESFTGEGDAADKHRLTLEETLKKIQEQAAGAFAIGSNSAMEAQNIFNTKNLLNAIALDYEEKADQLMAENIATGGSQPLIQTLIRALQEIALIATQVVQGGSLAAHAALQSNMNSRTPIGAPPSMMPPMLSQMGGGMGGWGMAPGIPASYQDPGFYGMTGTNSPMMYGGGDMYTGQPGSLITSLANTAPTMASSYGSSPGGAGQIFQQAASALTAGIAGAAAAFGDAIESTPLGDYAAPLPESVPEASGDGDGADAPAGGDGGGTPDEGQGQESRPAGGAPGGGGGGRPDGGESTRFAPTQDEAEPAEEVPDAPVSDSEPEPEPAPAPEPEVPPVPEMETTSEGGPTGSYIRGSGSIGVDTPVGRFGVDGSGSIETNLTSGEARPATATTAGAPAAPAAPSANVAGPAATTAPGVAASGIAGSGHSGLVAPSVYGDDDRPARRGGKHAKPDQGETLDKNGGVDEETTPTPTGTAHQAATAFAAYRRYDSDLPLAALATDDLVIIASPFLFGLPPTDGDELPDGVVPLALTGAINPQFFIDWAGCADPGLVLQVARETGDLPDGDLYVYGDIYAPAGTLTPVDAARRAITSNEVRAISDDVNPGEGWKNLPAVDDGDVELTVEGLTRLWEVPGPDVADATEAAGSVKSRMWIDERDPSNVLASTWWLVIAARELVDCGRREAAAQLAWFAVTALPSPNQSDAA